MLFSLRAAACNISTHSISLAWRSLYADPLFSILAFVFLRSFTQHGHGHSIDKLNKHVVFPLTLDLSAFCVPNISPPPIYHLYGIVVHMGGMCGGHYVAYTKRADGWVYFSDSTVKPSSEKEVLNSQGVLVMSFCIRRAVLFAVLVSDGRYVASRLHGCTWQLFSVRQSTYQ